MWCMESVKSILMWNLLFQITHICLAGKKGFKLMLLKSIMGYKFRFVKEISRMMKFGSEKIGGTILKGKMTLQVHYGYI